jgi:PhnB protein
MPVLPARTPERTPNDEIEHLLNYGGNCEQAFRFYEKHLGGKINFMMTHGQNPDANNVPDNWKNAILHAHMFIGENEIMASDVSPDRFQPMRSVYLTLSADSNEEAERIHALLSEAARSSCPYRRLSSPSVSACLETSSALLG